MSEPHTLPHLTFRLGGRIRGLETRRVVRVAEIHHVAPLPSDLRCNLGLAIHRGVVVGLMDLEQLEAQSADPTVALPRAAAPEPPFFCVFARFPGGVAGFPIDELLDLATGSEREGPAPFVPVDLDALEIFL